MVVSKHIWRAVVRMMDERHTMWSQGEGENQDWWVKVPGRQISAQGLEKFSHSWRKRIVPSSSKSPSLDTLGQRCTATWRGYRRRRATDEHSHQRHFKVPAVRTGLSWRQASICSLCWELISLCPQQPTLSVPFPRGYSFCTCVSLQCVHLTPGSPALPNWSFFKCLPITHCCHHSTYHWPHT